MKNSDPSPTNACGCGPSGCSPAGLTRRDFIKAGTLASATLFAGGLPVMAGPFSAEDFAKLIPSDKRLSKDWIASLYARGKPLTATKPDLKFIGMPINGIGTGQVYLGGDGRLWYWSLDGEPDMEWKQIGRGHKFVTPDTPTAPLDQGFALQVGSGAGKRVHLLDAGGFDQVTFTNQYPMARVTFADAVCPVRVALEAYTPFVPLKRDDSSYPVIVMRYTIENTSDQSQQVAIAGWVENLSNVRSGKGKAGVRLCQYRETEKLSVVECWAKPAAGEGHARETGTPLDEAYDFGAIALGLLGEARPDIVDVNRSEAGATGLFEPKGARPEAGRVHEGPLAGRRCAAIGRALTIEPGGSATVAFSLSWRFPNARHVTGFGRTVATRDVNFYSTLWPTAGEAAGAVAVRERELHAQTRSWVETWYDSTLPHWFLERTFFPLDCMQTKVASRLALQNGRYSLDEGANCCEGNCTHVWHYAQALARIFPVIERECREEVEYGRNFNQQSGAINFRCSTKEFKVAVDGQCGTILRVLRESQMTTDHRFLGRIWERTRLSMDFVIREWDADEDGLLAGAQHNTLDQPWFGQVPWLINLYHAALKASALMARQMNQPRVAERYEAIVGRGAPAMIDSLWNERYGYFIHKPGEAAGQKHGSTTGCHIDQVLGEFWLRNLGIEPVLPQEKIRRVLESLWQFNFSPNVGDFRKVMTSGRWYAVEGNAGLIMCTFPFGRDESGQKKFGGYLNECMSGFEWQVAALMIWEGMVEKGLAVGKAIYDRYLPKDRNPYNEIECGDHYARAMASYSAFLAVCGYQYDGPAGRLAFGPRLTPENFRAAFTTAEGWGCFTQRVESGKQSAEIEMRSGRLSLREFVLDQVDGSPAAGVKVDVDGHPVAATFRAQAGRYVLRFGDGVSVDHGQRLRVSLS